MKTIRAILILFAMMVFLPAIHAQLDKANKKFLYYRFAEAIPLYIKAAEKEKDPSLRSEAFSRLADCYRFTNRTEMAREWYAKAIQFGNIDPINYLYYGQALKSTGNYAKAKAAFIKYSKLVPEDLRGNEFAASCDLPKKWDSIGPAFEIKNMTALNSIYADFGPTYCKGGIIFTSDRRINFLEDFTYSWTNNNYLDLYFAGQDNPENAFGNVKAVKSYTKDLNKVYHDGPATFSSDFKLIYLTRSYNDRTVKKSNIKNHLLKIFYAKTDGKDWSDEKPFYLNSENYSVAHPSLSADGKTIYFSSDMPGGFGGSDIWCCNWDGNKWGPAQNLGKEVNTTGSEVFPFIQDDATLYFASNGLPGFGGLDVFVTKKINGSWRQPANLQKPVNSSHDDFSFMLDTSGDHGFFSSNRPGGVGSDDIYASRRLPAIPEIPVIPAAKPLVIRELQPFFISGLVKDKNPLLPFVGATVYLLNTKTGLVKVLNTNAEGMYEATADRAGSYVAKAVKQGYIPDCLSLLTNANDSTTLMKAPGDLMLDKLVVNRVYKLSDIYYDYDKWYIRNDAKPELDNLAQLMKENLISIELGSHTDARGSYKYNMTLSQKRAQSVVDYLVQQGIAPSRLKAVGYGETRLANRCADGVTCTEAEHQTNRRTMFTVTSLQPRDSTARSDVMQFNVGDEVPIDLFDKNFFVSCTQYILQEEPSNAIAGNTTVLAIDNEKQPARTKDTTAVVLKTEYIRIPAIIATYPDVVTYRVQLFAYSKFSPLNSAALAGLRNVQYYEEEDLFKYTAGIFNTAREARDYRDQLIGKGFGDAFLVAFKTGKRIRMPKMNEQ